MALRLRVSIVFPRLGRLTPEDRQAYNDVRRFARQELRRALNDTRNRVRAAAPRRTARLRRSARVKNIRAIAPGAISMELIVPLFYAAPSNARGRSAGWFDRGIEGAGQRFDEVARRVVSAITPLLQERLRRQVLGTLKRAAASSSSLAVREIAGKLTINMTPN